MRGLWLLAFTVSIFSSWLSGVHGDADFCIDCGGEPICDNDSPCRNGRPCDKIQLDYCKFKTGPEECGETGMFPDPVLPYKYYVCEVIKNSRTIKAVKKECSFNTAFSADTLRCMTKEEFQALLELRKFKKKLLPRNETFVCPRSGTFQDFQNCRTYYVCSIAGENGEKRICPTGTFFDKTNSQCSPYLSEYCVNQVINFYNQQVIDANTLYREIRLKLSKTLSKNHFTASNSDENTYIPWKIPYYKRLPIRSHYLEYKLYNNSYEKSVADPEVSELVQTLQLPSAPFINIVQNLNFLPLPSKNKEVEFTNTKNTPTPKFSTTSGLVSTDIPFSTLLPISTTPNYNTTTYTSTTYTTETPLTTKATAKPKTETPEPSKLKTETSGYSELKTETPESPKPTFRPFTKTPKPKTEPPEPLKLKTETPEPPKPTFRPFTKTPKPKPLRAPPKLPLELTTDSEQTPTPDQKTKTHKYSIPIPEPLTISFSNTMPTRVLTTTSPLFTTPKLLATTLKKWINTLPSVTTASKPTTSRPDSKTVSEATNNFTTLLTTITPSNTIDNLEKKYICHGPGLFSNPFDCHGYYLCLVTSFKPYKLKAEHRSCGKQWFSESFKTCGNYKPFGCKV